LRPVWQKVANRFKVDMDAKDIPENMSYFAFNPKALGDSLKVSKCSC
jgi:hypothetical protein